MYRFPVRLRTALPKRTLATIAEQDETQASPSLMQDAGAFDPADRSKRRPSSRACRPWRT